MKRFLLVITFFCFQFLSAQVEDISFTLAPTAEYVWWDSQTGLAEDLLLGGKVGFGFGEYLELSGIFQTSTDLQTDFSSFGLSNYSAESFEVQDVSLRRYGGELKVNFSNGSFSPFASLGTGIQSLEVNDNKFEQIYAGLGVGFRLALSNRINLLIEGRATGFKIDAANNLLSAGNIEQYNVNQDDYTREDVINYGAFAALQFYLGGRKPGELSALDRAYLDQYRGGFKGWAWVLEPSLAFMSFDSDSFYRNTWMVGGYFGVDFTEFVGVRAYYFQSMEDEKISLDFDNLSTYGLEFRAKLNDGRGVNPYLILGGGYLDVQSGYQGVIPEVGAQSTGFANAGLGLDIPLGRNILITGGARAMATSSREVSNPDGPDALQTHVMYNAGVKIQVGKRPDKSGDLFDEDEDGLAIYEEKLSREDEKNYQRIRRLVEEYQSEIKKLDDEIKKTNEQRNTRKAIDLLEQKKRLSQQLSEVEQLERSYKNKDFGDDGEYLKMTPQEFENLIDRILEGIDVKLNPQAKSTSQNLQISRENELLARKIMELQNQIQQQNKALSDVVKNINVEKEKASASTEATLVASKTDAQPNKSDAEAKAENEMEMILKANSEQQKQLEARMAEMDRRIEDFNKQIERQKEQLDSKSQQAKAYKSSAEKAEKANQEMEKKIKELDAVFKEQEGAEKKRLKEEKAKEKVDKKKQAKLEKEIKKAEDEVAKQKEKAKKAEEALNEEIKKQEVEKKEEAEKEEENQEE